MMTDHEHLEVHARISEVEALKRDFNEEKEIVNRVWAALGCKTYADAKGRTIDEWVHELQRDKERLDWLESKTTKIQIMNDFAGSCGWREFGDSLDGNTVRSAIDAAMKEESK